MMSRRGFPKDLPDDYGDSGLKSAPVVLENHYSSSSLFFFSLFSLFLAQNQISCFSLMLG